MKIVFLSLLSLFFIGDTSLTTEKERDSLKDYFECCNSITIINDGEISEFDSNSREYNMILMAIQDLTTGSHDMPAFGVSLHEETITAMKSGLWLELRFNENKQFCDMPFDSLAFEINRESSGFNLVRRINGKYEGRCFYLDLNKPMETFYYKILSIIKKI